MGVFWSLFWKARCHVLFPTAFLSNRWLTEDPCHRTYVISPLQVSMKRADSLWIRSEARKLVSRPSWTKQWLITHLHSILIYIHYSLSAIRKEGVIYWPEISGQTVCSHCHQTWVIGTRGGRIRLNLEGGGGGKGWWRVGLGVGDGQGRRSTKFVCLWYSVVVPLL